MKALFAIGLLAPALALAGAQPPRVARALARDGNLKVVAPLKPLVEQGDRRAEEELGAIYDQGRGIAPDPAVAALLYREAAHQGSGAAQVNLAKMYLKGRGVPINPVEAYAWADAAAANGEPGGQRIIDTLAKTMPKAQFDRALSRAARYVELYVTTFRSS